MNSTLNKTPGIAHFLGFLIIFSFRLTASSQSAVSGPSYDASGCLQHEIFFDGKLYFAETNNFAIQMRGSTVKIRTWGYSNPNNVEPVRDYIYVTDGNTAYFITTFEVDPDAVAKSQTAVGHQLRIFNSFADIFTNACPPNAAGNMGPVWIATASAAFMQGQDQNGGDIYPEHFICPDWPDIGGERLKASWSLSSQPPYLPEYLVEYADENVFNVVNKFFDRWKQKTFPPIYKSGYTNAVYEALSWSDVDGLHIPNHFRLTSYIPCYDGSDNAQLQVQSTYEGFVTTVTTAELAAVSASPEISTWSRINEYRYGTINNLPVTYTSQTGSLLTKREVLKLMSGRAQFAERSKMIAGGRRKIVLACFLCLIASAIIIFLASRVCLR